MSGLWSCSTSGLRGTAGPWEAEVRAILADAVREPDEGRNLAQAIMTRFGELGGVELDLQPRSAAPRAVESADDNS